MFRRHVSQLVLVVYTISDIISSISSARRTRRPGRARYLYRRDLELVAPQVAELEQRVGARVPTWCVKEARTPDLSRRVSRSKYSRRPDY